MWLHPVSVKKCPNVYFAETLFKDLFPYWYYKNDSVKYFMQHIRNGLIIDLINS